MRAAFVWLCGLVCLCACQPGAEVVSQAALHLPEDFIADRLDPGTCTAERVDFNRQLRNVAGLASETDSAIDASSSLTVNHDNLSLRWRDLLALSYAAGATGNSAEASAILDTLVDLANADALLQSRDVSGARGQPCWQGGNPDGPCVFHTPQNVGFAFVAMMISAIVLEEHMTDAQRAALTPYFDEAYFRFVGPLARQQAEDDGLYELGDFGLGELAYARWTRDPDRAEREIRRRIAGFARVIERGGYIHNNSYRAYRGYWYHTLGAEAAYGYALVARRFGVDMFSHPVLAERFEALAARTVQGGTDYQSFLELPPRGNNAIRDPEDEVPHMHQFAINLPTVLQREFGLSVQVDPAYTRKARFETINRFVLYNADCYYGSM